MSNISNRMITLQEATDRIGFAINEAVDEVTLSDSQKQDVLSDLRDIIRQLEEIKDELL